jgi:NitT/TauT family transport system substrate-binding protein
MAAGDVDIAASAEYPVVGTVLTRENISVICSIDKYQGQYLVGRKDRGIENVADLQGKKIGLPRGTITQFYLGRLLYLNDLSMQDITLMNIQPDQYDDSIGNCNVDAILVPQAYLMPVEERLGSNAVIWQAQSNQDAFGVLTCRNDWIAGHPETVNRFLKSLDQAEDYSIDHPAEAKAIVQKRMNYTDTYMEMIWAKHQFSLTLDQSLLTALEDEGRWMINNNLTSEKAIPDFCDYIYTNGLEELKPEAVDIID